MKTYTLLLSIILTGLLFSSCKNDPPVPEEQSQETSLNFKVQANGEDLIFYQDYYDALGYRYQLETFRVYLSDVIFTNDANEKVMFNDIDFLKFRENQTNSPITPTSIVSELPEGNYKQMSFNIGVGKEQNLGDPSQYEKDHPLSIYQGMHWDWNTGYIFMKLEGRVDSMPGGGGSLDNSVLYHVGRDDLLRTVTLDIDLNVTADYSNDLTFGININKIFASETDTINILNDGFTHTTEDFVLAKRVMDNAQKAFYLIE